MASEQTPNGDRYRQFAANARKRARTATDARHALQRRIPPGQPILVGHHSEHRHRRLLERTDDLMRKSIEELRRADYWETRAEAVERREATARREAPVTKTQPPSPEGVTVGDRVLARFTNSGKQREFIGVIVGRTTNDWKVRADTSPYKDDEPGRVFKIAAAGSRTYSANNRLIPTD